MIYLQLYNSIDLQYFVMVHQVLHPPDPLHVGESLLVRGSQEQLASRGAGLLGNFMTELLQPFSWTPHLVVTQEMEIFVQANKVANIRSTKLTKHHFKQLANIL